jgi:hypothetical protein
MNLKFEVWRLGVAVRQGKSDTESMARMWKNIEKVEKVSSCTLSTHTFCSYESFDFTKSQDYFDVLSMARLAHASLDRRVVVTVYHAALEYYGTRVLFACIPGSNLVSLSTSTPALQQPALPSPFLPSSTTHQKMNQNQNSTQEGRPLWLDATLGTILCIAHKSLDANSELIYRYIWPLCIAAVKTRDPIHRDWIARQVKRAGVLLKVMGVPAEAFRDSMEWDTVVEGMLFMDEGGARSLIGLLN